MDLFDWLGAGAVVTIVIQTFGVVWWASQLSTRQATVEDRLNNIDANRVAERLSVLESDNRAQMRRLESIESKIDKLIEHKSLS